MSVEGEAASEPQGETGKRYYVVSGGSEKGPYGLEQLRASLEETALNASTLVRAEGETGTRALGKVLAQNPRPEPKAGRGRRQARSARSGASAIDLDNAYAPPGDDGDDAVLSGRPDEHEGNLVLGLFLGFFGGCIALVLGRSAKPQTRRGIAIGFGVAVVFSLIRVIMNSGR